MIGQLTNQALEKQKDADVYFLRSRASLVNVSFALWFHKLTLESVGVFDKVNQEKNLPEFQYLKLRICPDLKLIKFRAKS